MPKKTLPHLVVDEDRELLQFHFDGPIPRIGEVIQVESHIFVVKAIRWQTWTLDPKPTDQDPSENRAMMATLTVKRLDGYDFSYETEGDGHLPPQWWKKFPKVKR